MVASIDAATRALDVDPLTLEHDVFGVDALLVVAQVRRDENPRFISCRYQQRTRGYNGFAFDGVEQTLELNPRAVAIIALLLRSIPLHASGVTPDHRARLEEAEDVLDALLVAVATVHLASGHFCVCVCVFAEGDVGKCSGDQEPLSKVTGFNES